VNNMKRDRKERWCRKLSQKIAIFWWGTCGLFPRGEFRKISSGPFYKHADGLKGLRPALKHDGIELNYEKYKPVFSARGALVSVFADHIPHYLYMFLMYTGLYGPFINLNQFYWGLGPSDKIQFWIASLLVLTLAQLFLGPSLTILFGFFLYIALTARNYRG